MTTLHDQGYAELTAVAAPRLPRSRRSVRELLPQRGSWPLRRLLFVTVLGAFIAAILASYAVPLWFQLRGERLLVVTSGSMAPDVMPGDAVVIRPVTDASQLRLGQVVTFAPVGTTMLVTHRIVGLTSLKKLDDTTGQPIIIGNEPVFEPYIRTKGDANESADPNLTPAASVRGIVLSSFSGWGYALSWAHSPMGRLVLFAPPLILLVLAELRSRSDVTRLLVVPAMDRARRLRGTTASDRPGSNDGAGTTDGDRHEAAAR
ncbi:MAG: signal peptidase I [Actinobacteria bacterium]|jgi:signal peptidase|nr:signal peptidase I [Actinomycetota bacterium]